MSQSIDCPSSCHLAERPGCKKGRGKQYRVTLITRCVLLCAIQNSRTNMQLCAQQSRVALAGATRPVARLPPRMAKVRSTHRINGPEPVSEN